MKKKQKRNGKITVTVDEHVLPYARKVKNFSTTDVVEKFGISKGSAVAFVAIMRIKRAIESAGKTADGVSLWRYVA